MVEAKQTVARRPCPGHPPEQAHEGGIATRPLDGGGPFVGQVADARREPEAREVAQSIAIPLGTDT
jgi:hypothetical protein